METANRKAFIDKSEALLAAIRSTVLVHAQEGLHPSHLTIPLQSARSLNDFASRIGVDAVRTAADALEAWITLLASEVKPISHMRTRSLLDQISEVEVALVACKNVGPVDVVDFVEESFDSLQVSRNQERPVDSSESEIDVEMLEVFREEAASLLQSIERNLDLLRSHPDDLDALWEIKRNAHTLKGAAGIVGMKRSSELSHRVEDLLEEISKRETRSVGAIFDLLRDTAECLRTLSNGENSDELDIQIGSLYDRFANVLVPVDDGPNLSINASPTEKKTTAGAQTTVLKPTRSNSIVRISLDRFDELGRNVRDLVASRCAFEEHIVELRKHLEESGNNTLRLQAASRKMERFGPFPFQAGTDMSESQLHAERHQNTYELTETARDAAEIDSGFVAIKSRLEALFEKQRAVIAEIQERLMRLRNVEFSTIAQRLQRTVRVTCDEEGKRAELVIENGSLEIDTQVIDSLIEPLMHLLKNAVVHGIEPAETRRLLGKPEIGKITVRVSREPSHILVSVHDDGCGIAFQTLVEKAAASELISRSEAAAMTGEQLKELLFMPGLTTAEKLSLNAGRGVGMSIIRESVTAAGGIVSIETWPQKGTTFYLRVPLPFDDTTPRLEDLGMATIPAVENDSSVLVVDDSPSVRIMMSKLLERNGWRVHTAKNGIDALEKLVEMAVLPRVILSDIEMPIMGGFEFIAALRNDETLKNIPVVFVSSRTAAANREYAFSAGAADYLIKPWNDDELIRIVERLATEAQPVSGN